MSDPETYAQLQEENAQLRQQLAQSEQAIEQLKAELEEQSHVRTIVTQDYQLLQTLLHNLPVATFAKAADGRFTLWNAASEELFGLQAGTVLGKTDFDFFPVEQAEFFRQKDQEVFAQGTPLLIPVEPIDSHAQGRRMLRTIKVPIYNEAQSPHMLLVVSIDITDQVEMASEREALQAQVIEAQRSAIQEISTPLIPLSSRVLLLPLIGAVDSHRAQRVLETLLTGIAEYQAEQVILDITGVQLVDTLVADALIRAAQAARLLGAHVILTGIRPEVAQTLVQLGLSLEGILTQGSLQNAVSEALVGR
jgi:rsbT co-antagonist protein RsbR